MVSDAQSFYNVIIIEFIMVLHELIMMVAALLTFKKCIFENLVQVTVWGTLDLVGI